MKLGDIVLIKQGEDWIERIFVKDGRDSGVLVVELGDKSKFLKGEPFDMVWYAFDEWKPIDYSFKHLRYVGKTIRHKDYTDDIYLIIRQNEGFVYTCKDVIDFDSLFKYWEII